MPNLLDSSKNVLRVVSLSAFSLARPNNHLLPGYSWQFSISLSTSSADFPPPALSSPHN